MAFPNLQVQNPGHLQNRLSFPWAEFVSRSGNTSDATYGYTGGGQHIGMNILIYWKDLETALVELLGYPFISRGTYFKPPLAPRAVERLFRYLPFRHPRFGSLWCTRIVSVKGVKTLGKTIVRFGPIDQTELLLLGLQFTRPIYPVLSESAIKDADGNPQEWLRFTDRYWSPSVQMLTREGMQYRFDNGDPLVRGLQFQGGVGQKIAKAKLKRTWYQLPELAIFNSSGYPSNLVTFLGKLNSEEFMGSAAETLLLEAVEITPHPLPIPLDVMGLQLESFPTLLDVTFHMEFFDPELGPGGVIHGHNNMPWSGDGRWYRVVSVVGNNPPFGLADFRRLFGYSGVP